MDGKLQNGADVALEFIPDGTEFDEYLVIETDDGKWELQFPNTVAKVPEGELIVTPKNGPAPTTTRGRKTLPSIEAMGFRLCLLAFIEELQNPIAASPHRLSSCRSTIRVIEEMEACAKA